MLEQLNIKKPFVQMWLDFIIKAIKTEPCPYVYIWSGVTVMSEGGQRGTGDDYVLCLFFSKTIPWNEGGDRRDLLEERVKTSHLEVVLDELTSALKGNVGTRWFLVPIWNLDVAADWGDDAEWARWGNDAGWRHNRPLTAMQTQRRETSGHYTTSLCSLKLLRDHVSAFRKKTTENRLLP